MPRPRRRPVPDEQAAARLAALREPAQEEQSSPPAVRSPLGWVADPPGSDRPSGPAGEGAADPLPAAAAGRPGAEPKGAGPRHRGSADPVPAPEAQRSWRFDEQRGGVLEQDLTEPPQSLVQRLRAGRVDPGRRGVAALALLAVVAAAVTGVVVLRGRPQAVQASTVLAPGAAVPGVSAAPAATLVVAVSGDVRRPGIVRLPAGSRVDDAIRAAGGALRPRDLALVNLARKVADGEQVVVGAPAAAPGAPAADGTIDLNTATADQLDELPGVGPVLAQKIVAYRTENGRFASVDQLREVSGIGESRYADLKTLVRV